jgi:hypothetical protein
MRDYMREQRRHVVKLESNNVKLESNKSNKSLTVKPCKTMLAQAEAEAEAEPPIVPQAVKPEGNGAKAPELEKLRLRICGWFRRRANTPWDGKDIVKLKRIVEAGPLEEELRLLDAFYRSPDSYHRKDVPTLLNNWTAEIDRARDFARSGPILRNNGNGHAPKVEIHPWMRTEIPKKDRAAYVCAGRITEEQMNELNRIDPP